MKERRIKQLDGGYHTICGRCGECKTCNECNCNNFNIKIRLEENNMKEKFTKTITLKPPFDKRNTNPKKNYGIGALQIWFVLKGSKGAVQVQLGTKLYLRQNMDSIKELFHSDDEEVFDCWDVGFHSLTSLSYMKGDKPSQKECQHLDGKPCWYDGSSLRGRDDKVVEGFIKDGEEFIWKYLEKYYKSIF